MKNILIKIIINIIGALACFIIFASHEFLDKVVDNTSFLFPWWIWGIIGVVLFELAFIIISFKR